MPLSHLLDTCPSERTPLVVWILTAGQDFLGQPQSRCLATHILEGKIGLKKDFKPVWHCQRERDRTCWSNFCLISQLLPHHLYAAGIISFFGAYEQFLPHTQAHFPPFFPLFSLSFFPPHFIIIYYFIFLHI